IRSLGIELGQGYGLGRPSAAADAADTVASWNARAALRPLRPRDGRSRSRMAVTAPPQERRKTYARPTLVRSDRDLTTSQAVTSHTPEERRPAPSSDEEITSCPIYI